MPSAPTAVIGFSTDQATAQSTVIGYMASPPVAMNSLSTAQIAVHSSEKRKKPSKLTRGMRLFTTVNSVTSEYMPYTPTDALSFSTSQAAGYRTGTGYMPSTQTNENSFSTRHATGYSTVTGYMLSTPTYIMSSSPILPTAHIATIGFWPSTTISDSYSTSQAITGTTIQAILHPSITVAAVAGIVTGGLAGLATIAGGGLYIMKDFASCQRMIPDSIEV